MILNFLPNNFISNHRIYSVFFYHLSQAVSTSPFVFIMFEWEIPQTKYDFNLCHICFNISTSFQSFHFLELHIILQLIDGCSDPVCVSADFCVETRIKTASEIYSTCNLGVDGQWTVLTPFHCWLCQLSGIFLLFHTSLVRQNPPRKIERCFKKWNKFTMAVTNCQCHQKSEDNWVLFKVDN